MSDQDNNKEEEKLDRACVEWRRIIEACAGSKNVLERKGQVNQERE